MEEVQAKAHLDPDPDPAAKKINADPRFGSATLAASVKKTEFSPKLQ
jgi:hypothetical protein